MNTDKHINFNWIAFDKQRKIVKINYNVHNHHDGSGYEADSTFTFEKFTELVDFSTLKKLLK